MRDSLLVDCHPLVCSSLRRFPILLSSSPSWLSRFPQLPNLDQEVGDAPQQPSKGSSHEGGQEDDRQRACPGPQGAGLNTRDTPEGANSAGSENGDQVADGRNRDGEDRGPYREQ